MHPVYLLDTNILSDSAKPMPNMSVLRKIQENQERCAICATVWQEFVRGYKRMPEGRKKRYIEDFLIDIKNTYVILPYDDFAAQICGELQARCENAGTPAPRYDSQIAATAIANGMILVTHNTEDYAALCQNSMLKIEDWWE